VKKLSHVKAIEVRRGVWVFANASQVVQFVDKSSRKGEKSDERHAIGAKRSADSVVSRTEGFFRRKV
jgi:hypothetical protein